MIRTVLLIVAAAAALAAAAGTLVVALAFTLYALMRGVVGPAGAAATVAGAAALLMLIAGLIAAAKAGAFRKKRSLGEEVANFVREKPVTSAAAALAAGVFAVRNPKALMPLVFAFLEPKGKKRP